MDKTLTQFYDELKSELSQPSPAINPMNQITPGNLQTPTGSLAWRGQALKECDKLKEGCYKRILLDMYCKIIPLDPDYVAGNQGQMKSDIDSLLSSKGMTAAQYITSGYEKTNAPLLEFILRSGNNIGKEFMRESDETLKDAKENNISVPPPMADPEDEKTDDQIIEIEKDTEYETFIDKLKEKTINKIVTDVSKIITDKKEENDMEFDPKPIADVEAATESTISVAMNYLNNKMWKENVELTPDLKEEMIGLAIRESTLNQLDCFIFKQPDSDFKSFSSKIRLGRGTLINESAVSYFIESANSTQRFEPLYKETDGDKYDVANHEKISKDGKKTPMTDAEAKKNLDPEGYKAFQNKNK